MVVEACHLMCTVLGLCSIDFMCGSEKLFMKGDFYWSAQTIVAVLCKSFDGLHENLNSYLTNERTE